MSITRISSKSLALSTADQVVSSASNFLFLILLAITLSVSDFARASTIWVVISFSVVMQRSVFGVPVLLDSNIGGEKHLRVSGARLGSIAVGAPASILALTFFIESRQILFLYLGLLVPIILLQDLGRYVAISESQSIKALVADLFLLVPVIGAILFSWMSGEALEPSVVAFLFAFGLVGAWIIVSGSSLIRFSLDQLNDIFRTDKVRRKQLFFDAALISGTALGSVALVWSIFGTQGVAAFNGALTALAPIGLATLVVQLVVQHGIVGSFGKVKSRELGIFLFLLVLSGLWIAALVWAPSSIGTLFLGDTWVISKTLFVALGFSLLAGLILEFLIVALRAQGCFDEILTVRKFVISAVPFAYIGAKLMGLTLEYASFALGFWGFVLSVWILVFYKPFSFGPVMNDKFLQ